MQYMQKFTMYIQSCLSLLSTTQKRILLFHMEYVLHLERMIACTWASGSGNLGIYISLRVAKNTVNNAIQVMMAPNTHLPPHKWAKHLSCTGQIIQSKNKFWSFTTSFTPVSNVSALQKQLTYFKHLIIYWEDEDKWIDCLDLKSTIWCII